MSAQARYLSKQKKYAIGPAPVSRLTVLLFCLGFFVGSLIAYFLRQSLYAPSLTLFENTVGSLASLSIDRNDVFLYSLKENSKAYLLLFFFALTNVWHFYYVAYTLYAGFTHGLLFCFCILLYGTGGILIYPCFLLPQSLFTIPAYLLGTKELTELHRDFFSPEYHDASHKKRQLLLSKLPFFLLCAALFILSALTEGYFNIPLLRAVL